VLVADAATAKDWRATLKYAAPRHPHRGMIFASREAYVSGSRHFADISDLAAIE
jgi:hypothetical protein